MTQILYAHMNKKKRRRKEIPAPNVKVALELSDG
jgi:hypothetical protein